MDAEEFKELALEMTDCRTEAELLMEAFESLMAQWNPTRENYRLCGVDTGRISSTVTNIVEIPRKLVA